MRLIALKYWNIFTLGLQDNLVYRWNFFLRGSFAILALVYASILWFAAYQEKELIGGFTLDQTITYFIWILFFNYAISAMNEDYKISFDIRNGLINQFLLKPVNYLGYRLANFFAARIISSIMVLPAVLISLFILRNHVTLPTESWVFGYGILAAIMAALIHFLIAYCFGLLAFWFLEIQGFVILSLAIEMVLSGQFFPLDLLPEPILKFVSVLPFYYQMYFPVAIFSGRIEQTEALQGLLVQMLWVVGLLLGSTLIWKRGLRKHTAVGG